jgi:hypothetical protein
MGAIMTEILRPMSTGELMDRTFALYRRNFKLFVAIGSLGPACYLVFQLLIMVPTLVRANNPRQINPFAAASVGLGFFAGMVIMLAGSAIAHGATVRAVAAVHLGQSIRAWEAYRGLKGKIWRILGAFFCAALLAGLVILAAIILISLGMLAIRTAGHTLPGTLGTIVATVSILIYSIVAAILAAVVWTRYALAIACCVVENLGVIKSIHRSAALTKGRRFRIFLVYLVFVVLAMVVAGALGALAGVAHLFISNLIVRLVLTYMASFIAGILCSPLATIGIALVYYDERVRKEAFDLQFMMSSLPPPVEPAAVLSQP